jgi:hypothetical protein
VGGVDGRAGVFFARAAGLLARGTVVGGGLRPAGTGKGCSLSWGRPVRQQSQCPVLGDGVLDRHQVLRTAPVNPATNKVAKAHGSVWSTTLRNLAIGVLKPLGADNIAKTTRAIRDEPGRALPILGITNNPAATKFDQVLSSRSYIAHPTGDLKAKAMKLLAGDRCQGKR